VNVFSIEREEMTMHEELESC